MPPKTKLSCRNVWKLYGPNAEALLKQNPNPSADDIRDAGLIGAVRNANIDIAEGEIFIIMGLSGSGKSTLVRCLSRLIEPTGGEVIFDDADLLRANDKELIEIRRHKIGMVFQHFALLPHLTVLQNVMFPLTIQATPKAEVETKAREVVELVGLKGREDYYPRELSGGQQQRVGIARSLVTEPDLWFLDEPFSALDPLIRREMQDEFLRLQERLHKTIVFITHDFEEAVRLADRIAIMKDGEVIQIATPEELVMHPATEYVAEFTRHIPRSKVLTVGGVMTPGAAGEGEPIAQSARVSDVAERIIAADAPIPVVDAEGQPVGAIDRKAVAHVLFGDGDAA
ncbi:MULTISPECIES: glycine betaine/L-proline ABC transporter ATP-binding protein [unclassified Ruegeria]|uniref:quaternary amine ABC transporter ATP-binding protein n=1 Tax=unclassified Ruegeria TaxID=2625375 RepID=UPI0014911173|nr:MULTISPECIES: betaine/proline/choline family ABC transporter ATP-binding protein [unclassified Ruegeria]NOD88306.1 betaine/proline/choline family ABC transporter ATP-binding protein [Ruegeria sp. HKCCD4318]NOE13215.1 betaine/proline/choline family ABC transporter ATP-binding protein [Ruegeria sp. HKCCD4318-2]NOG11243.1 betaine/proline/choline family ABC transporter ATP-binding protein [Ruegeria sp. HKCCD4315]